MSGPQYIEVTTWSATRRHLSNPDRKVIILGAYRLVPLCSQAEADTEQGWTERYPMFWLSVKPFEDLPACKRCLHIRVPAALSTSGEPCICEITGRDERIWNRDCLKHPHA